MRRNLKTKLNSLGKIELRYITFDDLVYIAKLLDKSKDDKSFTIKLLFKQIINPIITVTEFAKIPEQELIELSGYFVEYENDTFKYYKETKGKEVFTNIRKALTEYLLEVNEKILSAFQPILKKVKSNLYTFQLPNVEILIQPYVKFGEQIKKIAESYVKIQKSTENYFSPIIQKLTSPVRSLSEILKPQIKLLSNSFEKYREFLKYPADFGKVLYEKYKITEKIAFGILKKYKWLMTPSMPAVFVFDVVEMGGKRGNQRKAMNKLFIEHFSKNNFHELGILVEDWKRNPLFVPRMKIFVVYSFA